MTVFLATKRKSLSSLHCYLSRCVVLQVSCRHAENVTCRTCDITLRSKKKAKIYISIKENDKTNSNAQCL